METTLCLATRIHETFLCNGVSVYAFHPHPPSQDARRPAVMLSRAAPAKFALLLHDATVGDARAQRQLALRYLRGRGVTQDLAVAHRRLRLSADQSLALAQRDLGELYEQGIGVTQDMTEALRLYRLAAAQGGPIAIARLRARAQTRELILPEPRLARGDQSASRISSSSCRYLRLSCISPGVRYFA